MARPTVNVKVLEELWRELRELGETEQPPQNGAQMLERALRDWIRSERKRRAKAQE